VYLGKVYWLWLAEQGLELHILSLADGSLQGRYSEPVAKREDALCSSIQSALVLREDCVLLVDTRGQLLALDCSSLYAENTTPTVLFRLGGFDESE